MNIFTLLIGGFIGYGLSNSKKFKDGGSLTAFNDDCILSVLKSTNHVKPIKDYYIHDNKLVIIFMDELMIYDMEMLNHHLKEIDGCNSIFQDHFEIGYAESYKTVVLPLYVSNFSVAKFKSGGIIDQYDGLSAKDVWESWTKEQKLHFLSDHKLTSVHASKVMDITYNELPKDIRIAVQHHVSRGQYESGGRIYSGEGEMDIKVGDTLILPKNMNLTVFGLKDKIDSGKSVQTTKWVVKNLYEDDFKQERVVISNAKEERDTYVNKVASFHNLLKK